MPDRVRKVRCDKGKPRPVTPTERAMLRREIRGLRGSLASAVSRGEGLQSELTRRTESLAGVLELAGQWARENEANRVYLLSHFRRSSRRWLLHAQKRSAAK